MFIIIMAWLTVSKQTWELTRRPPGNTKSVALAWEIEKKNKNPEGSQCELSFIVAKKLQSYFCEGTRNQAQLKINLYGSISRRSQLLYARSFPVSNLV